MSVKTKNTSITLGDHFDSFIVQQVKSGRFSTTSEVIREGLRTLEEREMKLAALRKELSVGEKQAKNNEFSTETVKTIKQSLS